MNGAPVDEAVSIAVEALLLRKANPDLPALEVLNHAMRKHYGRRVNFGELAIPSAPFALLVAEAFDGGMLPCNWAGLWQNNSHPKLRPLLQRIWADEVWPKFSARYCQFELGRAMN